MKTITKQQIKEIMDFHNRRLNLGMTLREASEKSGISNPLISQIEGSTRNPSFFTVIKLHNCYRKLEIKKGIANKPTIRKPKSIKNHKK